MNEITQEDQQLVEAARDTIKRLYVFERHHVGAAVRTKTGEVFTAVHLEANVGRVAVCAEAMAIGKAISEGFNDFDTIVAVLHPDPDNENREIRVVSPCGMCRELLGDYGPQINVILPDGGDLRKCAVSDLIPFKYQR